MMREICAILFKVFLVLSLAPAVCADIRYGGGLGTSGQPYEIYTAAHLNQIGLFPEDWNKSFILQNDIDLKDLAGQPFNIIGYHYTSTIYKHFTGVFDGQGHVIRNFRYSTPDVSKYVGLFGYAENAQIIELGLADVEVSSAGWYIGGLAGYQTGGVIRECFVTGKVTGGAASRFVGGLAGELSGTKVSACRSMAAVRSGDGSSYVGGLTGRTTTMSHCYSAGAVNGGIGSSNVGGLSGAAVTFTNCYWDKQASGQAASGGGTPKTTAEMQAQTTYAGWDFFLTWRICEGMNYPRLRWEPWPAGDIVCPEGVELADVLYMADYWLAGEASDADIAWEPDDQVNLADFAVLAAEWMEWVD